MTSGCASSLTAIRMPISSRWTSPPWRAAHRAETSLLISSSPGQPSELRPVATVDTAIACAEPGRFGSERQVRTTGRFLGTRSRAVLQMPFPSALPLGELALMRSYYRYVEPIQIAWRKRSRMALFGIESLDEIACGEIDLG